MHVDFKVTAWERVQIPEEMQEDVLKGLKDGTIATANDLVEFVGEKGNYDGVIAESEEQMVISENDGQPTIEFHKERGQVKPEWQNGKY